MHICMICGEACYCDMEDHESDQPADCSCSHEYSDDFWVEDDDCESPLLTRPKATTDER